MRSEEAKVVKDGLLISGKFIDRLGTQIIIRGTGRQDVQTFKPNGCTTYTQTEYKSLCHVSVLLDFDLTIFSPAPPQKHNNDVNMTALWLKNACLLHDLVTQHSAEQVE